MSNKALVVLAHPHLARSKSNKAIAAELAKSDLIEIRNLYDLYPNFFIDVEAEQKILKQHQLIVFQHPFFWYSMPPLLKMWFDDVLTEGFAYGSNGNELSGKHLLVSITTGGSETAYSEAGVNRMSIDHYLEPYVQTALLCKMKWTAPVVLFAGRKKNQDEIEKHAVSLRFNIESILKGITK